MFNQLQWTTFLVGALLAAIAPMVQAQTMALEPREAAIADAANQSLESSEGVVIAQQTETTIPITKVQIGETATGLFIELEIPDNREPQSFTSGFGETVIIDLINTRLDLETGDAIIQDNPAADIASVQVAPLDDNSVRITVIGQEQAPTVEVSQADGELIVGVATGAAIADQPPDAPILPESQAPTDEDAIRIVVTEDPVESPYLVPETTTGTRTDTSIFEIPQTIQVLPEQLLEDQQVITLEDAILNVPNAVRVNDGGGVFDDFAIRGFENAQILRDGFRDAGVAGARQGIEELANVEQIEVLSGPASILFGSLEPGGIINLVTKRPLPEFFAEVEVRAGSFNSVRPSLDISGPLTTEGDVLYRLNAAYQFSDEFPGIDTNLERFFVAPVL
ncbi:MAG: TonB-dependent receptor plug domain-containing protein, partial [Cyanobacteria bacterium P01_H01_bin.152]